MLGEKHSLIHDFPEHSKTIAQLSHHADFAKKADKYEHLDKEIRQLEIQNTPVDDEAMNQLKIERAELKDWLYQQILSAANT